MRGPGCGNVSGRGPQQEATGAAGAAEAPVRTLGDHRPREEVGLGFQASFWETGDLFRKLEVVAM